jgi:hypothetical protein
MITLPNWPDDFLFIYLFFPGVADVFLPFLQVVPQVTNVFPMGIPNRSGFQTHMFCPKSSPSHIYRWAKGGGTPSIHRIFNFLRAFIVSIILCRANQIQ